MHPDATPDDGSDSGTVLLVMAPSADDRPGGRAMLSAANHAILHDLFGERLSVFTTSGSRPRIAGLLTGHIDGIDRSWLATLLARVAIGDVTRVILDGSNRGAAARALKRQFPDVAIVTMLHNVEARFFLGALRANPGPRALAVLLANVVAERAAVRASDTLLCLSERDSLALARLYGRGADAILPIVVLDRAPAPDGTLPGCSPPGQPQPRHALFVGGGFYANRDGIRWFARHVAPRLSIPTRIVGRGLDDLATELAGCASLHHVGAVDDLGPWYRAATLVVAPILDGSGMKTKVAEAFVSAGSCVRDPDAFVAAIEAVLADDPPVFDPAMRALYDRFHAFPAARARMALALGM